MKVLIVGSEPHYNLEAFCGEALAELGHQVAYFPDCGGTSRELSRLLITRSAMARRLFNPTLTRIGQQLLEVLGRFDPDLVLTFKGEFTPTWVWQRLADDRNCKLVMWYPDSPRRFFSTLVAPVAPYLDHILTPSADHNPFYRAGGRRVYTLPFACSSNLHTPGVSSDHTHASKYAISFVGTWYPNRARALRRIRDLNPQVWGRYWRRARGIRVHGAVYGPKYVDVIRQSKISLNMHHERNRPTDGVNMRAFEVTGSGGFLLTDSPTGLDTYFVPGKELVVFSSLEELKEAAHHHLASDDERIAIAERGCLRAHREHTYTQRMREMLAVI